MRHLARYAILGLAWAMIASSPAAAQSAVLTSPFDGAWFNNNDQLDFGGDSSESGSVELQWFDNTTQEWAHCGDIQTSGDSFVNDQGETRYTFITTSRFGLTGGQKQYAAPGIVRDDGQRSNEISLTVWGWGATNTKEPGHYVSIYETCGRDGQQCCYSQSDVCDSGLRCTQGCSGTLCADDICTPAPSPPPNQEPPPPPPRSSCGGVGESCCQGICSTPNSVCASNMCTQPGVWWGITCECTTDGFSTFNVEIEACYEPTAQVPPYGQSCSQYAGSSGECAPLTAHGPDPSRGQCAAVTGNVRGK